MGDDVSRIRHHSLIFVKLKLSPVTGKNKMLSDVRGWGGGGGGGGGGLVSVVDVKSLFFLSKKTGFVP